MENERNILTAIAATKRSEIAALKKIMPFAEIKRLAEETRRTPLSMTRSIKSRRMGIIAEHKRRSPSKGEISPMSEVAEVAEAYAVNGAAAMSILTDTPYFGGSLTDLAEARARAPWLPLLRKEFIIDEYQVYQSRVYGADAILLIAAMLDKETIARLHELAHSLGMQTLVEVHKEDELCLIPEEPDMVGVNNRDLTSFATDISNSSRLIGKLPEGVVKVAESGIKTPEDVRKLKEAGFDAFLIGEAFMSDPDHGNRLSDFLSENV